MAELTGIVAMLRAQRQELLRQLAAVDRAIAALMNPAVAAPEPQAVSSEAPAVPGEAPVVAPTRVKARRVQSDEHWQAVGAGRRKARAAREAASGIARDMPDDGFVPAIGRRTERQSPRLVTRPRKP